MLSGLNSRPSACLVEVITFTPQHLAISPLSGNFISNVGLTRNKMLDLNFDQVKKFQFVETFLDAVGLEIETLCVFSGSDNCCATAPCD